MLSISDRDELLALNKALMEVRYLAGMVDGAIRGSAFLSAVHDRVVDELENTARESGNIREAEQWEDWRRLDGRVLELPKIVEYLSHHWSGLSLDARREALFNQLRPFKFSDEDVQRIATMIDRKVDDSTS